MKFEKEKFIGQVTGVYSSKHSDPSYQEDAYFFTKSQSKIELTLDGIVGERHYGSTFESDGRMKNLYERGTEVRFSRQWLAVSEFELNEIKKRLSVDNTITAEHIGANIVINQIEHLSELPMMSHLVFSKTEQLKYREPSNVVLVSYAQVMPCTIAAKAISNDICCESVSKDFVKASAGFRGLAGWIEKAGDIELGDYVFLLTPKGY